MDTSEFLVRFIDSVVDYGNPHTLGIPTHPGYSPFTRVSLSEEEDVPAKAVRLFEEIQEYLDFLSSLWTVRIERLLGCQRVQVTVSPQLREFITFRIIPYFCHQRKTKLQFAVVLLLSEKQLDDIRKISFYPSDFFGWPVIDSTFALMPQTRADYGNYLTARPSIRHHSEVALFGRDSVVDSPFSHLWSAYVERHRAKPDCVLIYSWNLPCSHCTDVIIRSLREEPYNLTSVIVTHTKCWSREREAVHEKSREKLSRENIAVEQVPS